MPLRWTLMRDLAQRIVPVYQEADTDVFLANVTALQIVSGAYACGLRQQPGPAPPPPGKGKPFDGLAERAILDGIYAHARAIEAKERLGFAQAYVRSFQELVARLDNAQAAAVVARLATPLALYREPVRQAFDRWRAKGSLPQADAVALVRTWLEYESRRTIRALVPGLIAAENRSRYAVAADVRIPVRAGVVIHASVVRPGGAIDALPTLLRFTLDPAEDDAQRSAVKGYVGVTAYVRGRTPDGKGAAWPFVHDGEDAVAVIDWIARQPWSDGRVGMLGDGYSGYAAWAAARRKPAALKAIATIAPMAPGIDFPMAGQIYRNAMVRWAQEHATAGPRDADADADPDARWQALDALLVSRRSPLLGRRPRPAGQAQQADPNLADAPQSRSLLAEVPAVGEAVCADRHPGARHRRLLRRRGRRAVLPPRASSPPTAGRHDAAARPLRCGLDPARHGGDAARLHARPRRTRRPARAALPMARPRLQGREEAFAAAGSRQLPGDGRRSVAPCADAGHAGSHPAAPVPRHPPARRPAPSVAVTVRSIAEGGGKAQLSVDLADRRDARIPWPDALRLKQLPTRNSISFVSDPLPKDTEIDGSLRGEFDITPSRQDVDLSVSLYEQTASGEYQLLFEPYDFRASYAGHRVKRRLLRAGERQLLAFTAERVTARKLAAGSRLVLVIGLNKRPDRQINYGSGKDVNSETIADAARPVRVRWHARSHVEIQTGRP